MRHNHFLRKAPTIAGGRGWGATRQTRNWFYRFRPLPIQGEIEDGPARESGVFRWEEWQVFPESAALGGQNNRAQVCEIDTCCVRFRAAISRQLIQLGDE